MTKRTCFSHQNSDGYAHAHTVHVRLHVYVLSDVARGLFFVSLLNVYNISYNKLYMDFAVHNS